MQKELPRVQNFIDGKFVEPTSGNYLDNIEPATGKPYSQVADSGKEDVDLAVAAAEKAFSEWSKTPAQKRSQILLRIADLIDRDLEKLARAESIDTGKPLSLARSLDIPRAASNFRSFTTADPKYLEQSTRNRWRRVRPHPAPAARCRRTNFAVELAAVFTELENRARHRGR